MAFEKIVQHASGVEVKYWRITKVEIDLPGQSTKLTMSGYVSVEARNAGKNPLASHTFIWTGADNPVTMAVMQAGTAFQACYNKMKNEQPKALGALQNPLIFNDATNV